MSENRVESGVGLEEDSENDGYNLRSEIEKAAGTSNFSSITKLSLTEFVFIHTIFQELPNLEILSLRGGWISQITNLHLMTKLETLDLSDNRIDNLDGLEHNINLRTLILDNNPIIFLKESTFAPLIKLNTISLCKTAIYNLCQTTETLSILPQLQHLSFQKSFKQVEAEQPKSLSQYFFSTGLDLQENVSSAFASLQALTLFETLNANSINALQSLRDRIRGNQLFLTQSTEESTNPAPVEEPSEIDDLLDSSDDEEEDARDIDEESKEIEKRLSELINEPKLKDALWELKQWSPLCQEPHYRAYMIHQLPQISSLDGIDIDDDEREKAKEIFDLHFEMLPFNIHDPVNLTRLLTQRETNFTPRSQAFTKIKSCASHYGKHKQPRLKKLCPKLTLTPRQFEYNPNRPDRMVFGTTSGEIVVLNPHSDTVVGTIPPIESCSVLGLSWLHNSHGESKFIAGCDNGEIKLMDINLLESGRNPLLHSYDRFPHLSSITINCTDEYFLSSGHTNSIHLYDLKTSKLVNIFSNIHDGFINVSKFSNFSPFLFATSSFDRSMKLWDMREKGVKPIYTRLSYEGIVMVTWSPDDKYLLTSATDNEVRQYLSVDGKLERRFDIKRTNSNYNYTRSYYMGTDYVIVGSCEESVVRIYNAKTGKLFRDVEFNTVPSRHIKYVQSLRGDPFHPFSFAALIAHKPPGVPFDLTKVDLMEKD